MPSTANSHIRKTHQRNEARALSDNVILLEAGRIVRVGNARDLLPQEMNRDMTFDETPLGDPLRSLDAKMFERR